MEKDLKDVATRLFISFSLASLLLLLTVAFMSAMVRAPAPVQQLDRVQPECPAPPGFQPSDSTATPTLKGGWILQGRGSALIADICFPGTLQIEAHQEAAGNEAAKLIVSDGLNTLANIELSEISTAYLVPVREPGRVVLMYLNDYYESEYRAVEIRKIRQPNNEGCQQAILGLQVPLDGGGGWSRDSNYGSLISNQPATAQLCGPGLLTLEVRGTAMDNEYPIIIINAQGGKHIEVETDESWQAVEIQAATSNLEISLKNAGAR